MSASVKILLIEDDPGISDTLRRVLAGEGHDVTVEKRGDDGLARATADSFNVVITDLRLPGLSGLELIRQLHAAHAELIHSMVLGDVEPVNSVRRNILERVGFGLHS